MNNISNYFLEPYKTCGFMLQEKARFLLSLNFFFLFLAEPIVVIVLLVNGFQYEILYSILLSFSVIFSSFFLRRGWYSLAVHFLLTSHFIVLWSAAIVSYFQNLQLLILYLPLIFIIIIIFLLPVLILRRTLPLVLSLVFNGIFLVIFNILIYSRYSGIDSFCAYVTGISSCMFLAGIVALFNFKTNNKIFFLFRKASSDLEKQHSVLKDSRDQYEVINNVLLHSQKEIKDSADKYKLLYDNALVGMITIEEPEGIILKYNMMASDIFGFSTIEATDGLSIKKYYLNSESRIMLLNELKLRGEIKNCELRVRNNDGRVFWVETSAKFFSNENITEAVFTDITERKNTEENFHKLKYYDSLTELPNRRMLVDRLEQEISRIGRKSRRKLFAVMCIGFDRLKNVNDMYGSLAGDSLLKAISNRLKSIIRDDDFISRIDGGKFVILFSEIGNTNGVLDIINKINSSMQEHFLADTHDIMIKFYMGVCFYPNDAVSPYELIANSETAMYTAKERGRNSYHLYDASLNKKLIDNLKLEKALRDAVYQNEFIPYFQPKVDSAGRITGVESLIRWNSFEKGLVSPCEFIPLAEKNGMIIEIGKLILRKTSLIVKEWCDMGIFKSRVSVNISPAQFKDPNLIDDIKRILVETSFSPEYLDLEITETGIMENEEECIKKLSLIQEMGITVSIDDFGTGYSSLSKLRDYPVDILKIDKSFIDKLPEDDKSTKIAVSIIDLAHNLGFTVVGEGIEKQEQLDFLDKYYCDQYQGFFFSRPLPPEDFEKLLLAESVCSSF